MIISMSAEEATQLLDMYDYLTLALTFLLPRFKLIS